MTLSGLFFEFAYIGLFSFGGGFATIPFLHRLIENIPTITAQDLTHIIALAEMTPGAVGVNMATYTGYMTGNVVGGLVATLGLILPSFILVSVLIRLWQRIHKKPLVKSAFNAIKASVCGLLAGVGITLTFACFTTVVSLSHLCLKIVLLTILTAAVMRWRPSPIYYILGMGVVGMLLRL